MLLSARESVASTLASLQGEHQREGVRWMCRRESHPGAVPSVAGGILADDMGLGKTYQVTALMRLRPTRTLIVTPLSTLMQWQDVLSSQLGALPLVVRTCDQSLGRQSTNTVLTTYSVFQRGGGGLLSVSWGRIVLDEAHVIRNPKSHAYRTLCKSSAAHRWVVTGTPIHNSVRDLNSLVGWLGAPGLDIDMIRAHLILRRTKTGEAGRTPTFNIPSMTVVDSVVTMGEVETRAYDMLEASGALYARADGDKHVVPSSHLRKMEAILRCRQACTHVAIMREAVAAAMSVIATRCTPLQAAMSTPDMCGLVCQDPVDVRSSSKINRLVHLLSTHSDTEKSLVFCDWLLEMDIIEEAIAQALDVKVLRYHGGMDVAARQDVLCSFASMEDGTVLLMQIQCGGTGLNIQCASRVYLMRPAWNPCVEQQAVARAHRQGQTRPVVMTRLIAAGTIDVRCLAIQSRKMAVIDALLVDMDEDTAALLMPN